MSFRIDRTERQGERARLAHEAAHVGLSRKKYEIADFTAETVAQFYSSHSFTEKKEHSLSRSILTVPRNNTDKIVLDERSVSRILCGRSLIPSFINDSFRGMLRLLDI